MNLNPKAVAACIAIGGGILLFWFFTNTGNDTQKFSGEGDDQPSAPTDKQKKDAEVVLDAYMGAVANDEPPMTLSDINKECMKDYGLRCYQDNAGMYTVCDGRGTIILTAA